MKQKLTFRKSGRERNNPAAGPRPVAAGGAFEGWARRSGAVDLLAIPLHRQLDQLRVIVDTETRMAHKVYVNKKHMF